MAQRRWRGKRKALKNLNLVQRRYGAGPRVKKKPVMRPVRTRLTTPFDTPRVSPAGVPYARVNKDPMIGIRLTNELERLVGRPLPFTHSLLWKLGQH